MRQLFRVASAHNDRQALSKLREELAVASLLDEVGRLARVGFESLEITLRRGADGLHERRPTNSP